MPDMDVTLETVAEMRHIFQVWLARRQRPRRYLRHIGASLGASLASTGSLLLSLLGALGVQFVGGRQMQRRLHALRFPYPHKR